VFTTAPVSVPVTRGTPVQPARGYHVSRFAPAESHGLISAAEFAAVTGPFQTASEALPALRPADRSFLAPGSRLGLLTETLRAAGVELGQWDREVARWLAGLDVQIIAPVIGWVSRAGREPAPGLIARALADAIAHRTALTSGCPDCAQAVGHDGGGGGGGPLGARRRADRGSARVDARIRQTRTKAAAAVRALGTSLTGLFGVGPVIAAAVIGDVRHVSRFASRDHFAT